MKWNSFLIAILMSMTAFAQKSLVERIYEGESHDKNPVVAKQEIINQATLKVSEDLIKEIRRILRYYTDRVGQDNQKRIARIVTSGGGATMPGINEYLAKELNLPSETLNPWDNLDFGSLKKPAFLQQSAYITVAGEAFLNPEGIYA